MQISELFSMGICDQVVMDFLVATEVGKLPPLLSRVVVRTDSGGVCRSFTFLLCLSVHFSFTFVY